MNTFAEIELIAPVQRALASENYEVPTPIQAQTIPPALAGHDILGCAQTGTGKTAAFALPILHKLGKKGRKPLQNRPNVLILAPTRELAIQIGESCSTYGKHLQVRHALIYGGVSQFHQVKALNRGVHIVVATPGRLLDLMNQGHIELDRLEILVLDEADRMLDMGFLPDLKKIFRELPEQRQSLFFSATLPPKITELAGSLLRDPVTVNVTPKSTSVDRIEQQLIYVDRSRKQSLLRTILSESGSERAIVFTKTKRGANSLAEQLAKSGLKATAIHGNKSQNARQRALDAFRRKQVNVLVATDVAARGIDIDGITHVFNFDLPVEPESYVHRIGRTGRAGADGIAISFCSGNERRELRAIEQLIGQKVPVARHESLGDAAETGSGDRDNDRSSSRPRRRPENRGPFKGPRRRPDGAKPSGERAERKQDGKERFSRDDAAPRRSSRPAQPGSPRKGGFAASGGEGARAEGHGQGQPRHKKKKSRFSKKRTPQTT
ncbi:DEAD/DEAH box helicase [Rubinisphaera margarita]|uniref:DEAD/DEAH box helicase n=1 Tax=Rubinisphaera margarita TaxID=2909586 RepID=UPI001EE87307|nr:DEAD/DEAH box helicase [Rubinisphaera margarita]MCG6156430.1 DEAD/DEAH box helicase [Rubinisphaera margarita]